MSNQDAGGTAGNPEVIDTADFLRHAVSRRSALRYGLVLGGAAVGTGALAGCTASGSTTSQGAGKQGAGAAAGGAAAQAPAQTATLPTPRNQTVIIGANDTFVSYGNYNPFIPSGDYVSGLGQVVKEYLFYLNVTRERNNLTPWLATGWEYNKDFTQITFHLDPNAHWNDGHPFTSSDVKFTIELFQKNPALIIPGLVYDVSEAYSQAASVQTPDDHTVVITLKGRNPRYHYNYICSVVGAFLIVPEHVWSGKDPTTFTNNPPVFTGPYKLKEANHNLQYYLWQKDPNYWNKAKLDPKPQYVGFVMKAGAMDVVTQEFKEAKFDQGANLETTQALIQSGYKHAVISYLIDPAARAVMINCDPSKGIVADPRMRWVVSLLLDREYIAKSVWQPATTPITYPWSSYSSMARWELPDVSAKYPLGYDPSRAAQLLDQMGAKQGSDGKRRYQGRPVNLLMINPGPNTGPEYQVGQLLVKEFGKLGIDVTLSMIPSPSGYQAAVAQGQFDLRSEYGAASPMDPYQTYSRYSSATYAPIGKAVVSGGDDVRLKNPAYDSLVARLRQTQPDPSSPVYQQMLTEWYEQMPIVPYINTLYGATANTSYWTGWPTEEDMYQPHNNWWGNYMFVIGHLQPTGKA